MFERLGLEPLLLSGDNERTVKSVARELGIERARSGVLPGEKAAVIRELQAAGEVVAMVGDGINDAPALAQADLGLALGSGTDIAVEAGDVTLTSTDLRAVADAVSLARRTLRTIKSNLFWAFAYNVAAIPIAATGLLESDHRGGGDVGLQLTRRREQPSAAPLWELASRNELEERAMSGHVDPGYVEEKDALDQAPAPHRRSGARYRAHGRRGALLHRHSHPGRS